MGLACSVDEGSDLYKVILAFLLVVAVSVLAKDPKAKGTSKIDIDLSRMSSTMVFAQVNQMVTTPQKFVGMRIKMKGVFSSYYDNETDQRFYGCVIADALACCSQGLAFSLAKPRKFPDEYPAEGETIVIIGYFDNVKEESGESYPIIRHAEILKE